MVYFFTAKYSPQAAQNGDGDEEEDAFGGPVVNPLILEPPPSLDYEVYMGKDKFENELLIKYGLDTDVWFHVDDLSSAHVYLRMTKDMTLDDIPEAILTDCAALCKANSIAGCKKATVPVVRIPS